LKTMTVLTFSIHQKSVLHQTIVTSGIPDPYDLQAAGVRLDYPLGD